MTESEIAVLISRLDSLKEQYEESKDEANTWRNRFDEKLMAVQVAVATLPCPARAEAFKGIKGQIAWIWAILCMIVAAIIGEWVVRK